jgi:hypothetical protein
MSFTHVKARPDDKTEPSSCRVRPDNFGADNPFGYSETSGCRVSVCIRVWVNVCCMFLKKKSYSPSRYMGRFFVGYDPTRSAVPIRTHPHSIATRHDKLRLRSMLNKLDLPRY